MYFKIKIFCHWHFNDLWKPRETSYSAIIITSLSCFHTPLFLLITTWNEAGKGHQYLTPFSDLFRTAVNVAQGRLK